MSLPNVLYLGTDKAGSTWLYDLLRWHADAFVPTIKDLYFFDREYDRGLEWYRRHFPSHERHLVRCDISHDYLYSRTALERINQDLPSSAILIFLRSPADRAISSYKFKRRNGLVESFEEACGSMPDILSRSFYARYVRCAFDILDEEPAVYLFDDLQYDAEGFARRILRDLGLNVPEVVPEDVIAPSLRAQLPRSPRAARVAKRLAVIMRSWGLEVLLGRLKASRALQSALYAEASEGQDWEATRARLRDYFADDVAELDKYVPGVARRWGY